MARPEEIVAVLTGGRHDSDDDMAWLRRLSKLALELQAEVQPYVAAERQRLAADLHAAGVSYAEIGRALGMTRQAAKRLTDGRNVGVDGGSECA
jgi:hypothetical protein